jgi:hypothetical protein
MNQTASTPVIPASWEIRVRLQRFAGSAEPVECLEVPLAGDIPAAAANFAGASWALSCELRPAADRPDAVDGRLCCRVTAGAAAAVNAAIELVLPDWDAAHFLMLPAAAYNGNRFAARFQKYPPIATDAPDLGPAPATMITDVPRLELDPHQPSRLHLSTGDETTPCITFFAPAGGYACILLTDQGGAYGNHGVRVCEDSGRRRAVLAIEAPCVRARLYTMLNSNTASWDRGARLETGDEIVIRFRLFRFPAADVQALYDRFAEVRQDLTGPVSLRHSLPFSAAWAIQEAKYNEHNWNPAGYYAVGVRKDWDAGDNKYQDWQAGWVGGGMVTLPLLFQGTPESRERALRTLDWLFSVGTGPAGIPYGVFHAGRPFSDHFRQVDSTRWVMVRRLGDVLYFACKHFDLLRKQDPAWVPPPAWAKAVRALADGLVDVFAKYGQLGQFLDWDTWEIVVGGSTAGAMVPGGLALAGAWFKEPRYSEAAARLARHFVDRDVLAGVTTGGPGEILQGPDSESAFALLESLVVLYETTGDRAWLTPAEAMARQCLTWCASYDYQFPPESWFGRLGMRAAGSVWANVQNKHSAPGICTLSGDSLFKLWRATGCDLYLEQLRQTAHNLPQYLSRADRPVGEAQHMPPGFMCERVNFSDWEGVGGIGGNLFGSCWCEVSMLLTAVEVPGIYVQPDVRRLEVFDHVDVVVLAPVAGRMRLRITNPTAFEARVKLLAESSRQARECPLGQNALWAAPVVVVPAGQTVEWTV